MVGQETYVAKGGLKIRPFLDGFHNPLKVGDGMVPENGFEKPVDFIDFCIQGGIRKIDGRYWHRSNGRAVLGLKNQHFINDPELRCYRKVILGIDFKCPETTSYIGQRDVQILPEKQNGKEVGGNFGRGDAGSVMKPVPNHDGFLPECVYKQWNVVGVMLAIPV